MEIIITYMVVAIVTSAICSVCEAALSSTPMSYVSMLEGKSGAATLRNFKENMDKPLSAILIVNTIANTVGASLVGSAASSHAAAQGIDESAFIGIISAIFTVLVLMCAEIVPKTIGANYWKSLIMTVVKIIKCMIWITYPFVWVLGFVTRMLSNEDATAMTREEIAAVGKEGLAGGVIDEQENAIIQRVLQLKKHTVEEIMIPATVVVSVKEDEELKDTDERLAHFSRLPVMNEKNACLGYVLKDDILDTKKVKECMHEIPSYADDTTVRDLFTQMAEKHDHIGAVVDQYGTFRGIITFEDVLESVLGLEIVDEDDKVVDMQQLAKQHLAFK